MEESAMVHIREITVAKAHEGEHDHSGPTWWGSDAILDILGGSVLDVLLSLIDAKGKGGS
jgi:hypothetical protein